MMLEFGGSFILVTMCAGEGRGGFTNGGKQKTKCTKEIIVPVTADDLSGAICSCSVFSPAMP